MIDLERVRVDIRRLTLGDLSDIERIEQRGRRRGYYTDNREDAIVMWRETHSVE